MAYASAERPPTAARKRLFEEYQLLIYAAALWLGPFCIFWMAALIGGGHPSAGPIKYVSLALASTKRTGLSATHLRPWEWVAAPLTNPVVFWVVALLLASAIVGAAVVAYWVSSGGAPIFRTSLGRRSHVGQRNARYAQSRELAQLRVSGPTPGRLVLGYYATRLLATMQEASVMLLGSPRTGKTAAFIIPWIIEHQGPVVATSTKPDVIDRTIGYRSHVGKVYVYDPTGATKRWRVRWSPLAGCKQINVALKRGSDFASAIGKSGKESSGGNLPYFRESGRKLLGSLFYLAAILDEPMRTVKIWIDGKNAPGREAVRAWNEAARKAQQEKVAPPPQPAGAIDEAFARARSRKLGAERDLDLAEQIFSEIEGRHPEERVSAYSTTGSCLDVFLEPAVADSADHNEFDIDDFLLSGWNTIYLVAPTDDMHRVAALFTGLIGAIKYRAYQIATEQGAPLDPELLLALDEAANIAPLEDLDKIASQGLSQGVKLITVLQDLSQAAKAFGEHEAKSLVNCHQCVVILPRMTDLATLDYFTSLAGNELHADTTVGPDGRRSIHHTERPLVTKEVVRLLEDGRALVMYDNFNLFIVDQRRYYSDLVLSAQSEIEWIAGEHVEDPVRLASLPTHPGRLGQIFQRVVGR